MPRAPQPGFTLIEMLITITIMALLIMIGLPNMTIWLNNAQIRTAGETLLTGLTLARVEAVRRNQIVRFQMVSDLTSACTISPSGKSWVVSLDDPTNLCDTAPNVSPPRTIQSRSGSEATPRVTIAAQPVGVVYFNGLGRPTSPGGALNVTQIDIANPVGGACQNKAGTGGPMRCLRILISSGGEARMCDPAVDPATFPNDPRLCP